MKRRSQDDGRATMPPLPHGEARRCDLLTLTEATALLGAQRRGGKPEQLATEVQRAVLRGQIARVGDKLHRESFVEWLKRGGRIDKLIEAGAAGRRKIGEKTRERVLKGDDSAAAGARHRRRIKSKK